MQCFSSLERGKSVTPMLYISRTWCFTCVQGRGAEKTAAKTAKKVNRPLEQPLLCAFDM
jgi:hypothetical protein